MILLDTNVVSEAMRPDPDGRVVEWMDSVPWRQTRITAAAPMSPLVTRKVNDIEGTGIGSGIPLFAGESTHTRFAPVDHADIAGGVRVVTLDRFT